MCIRDSSCSGEWAAQSKVTKGPLEQGLALSLIHIWTAPLAFTKSTMDRVMRSTSVSYTHLDVYKRQSLYAHLQITGLLQRRGADGKLKHLGRECLGQPAQMCIRDRGENGMG